MASPLKVTRLDSPLRGLRNDEPDDGRASAPPDRPTPSASAATPSARKTTPRRTPPKRRPQTPPAAPEGWTVLEALWEPPALDERVDLVSTRLPSTLARALELHTRGLRDRHDRASQKALPMQEVLAAIVWALGDPEDDATIARMDAIYRSYRARRMAAAAQALEAR
jgi:hypothetical protein